MRAFILIAALAIGGTIPVAAAAQRPDSALVGSWSGRAEITVPWTAQRDLMIRVVVRDDGSVSGTIGDAQLAGARIFSDRTALGRALRLGREYVVEGTLSGPILRSEGVQRASVRMPLDLEHGTLVGDLQTSGAYEGPPSTLAFTASGIVLRRTPAIISLRSGAIPSPKQP